MLVVASEEPERLAGTPQLQRDAGGDGFLRFRYATGSLNTRCHSIPFRNELGSSVTKSFARSRATSRARRSDPLDSLVRAGRSTSSAGASSDSDVRLCDVLWFHGADGRSRALGKGSRAACGRRG